MISIGDLVIYSSHGICQIDDICERESFGEMKKYYVLHPIRDNKLTISTPIDNKLVVAIDFISKEDAEALISSFQQQGAKWIEKDSERTQVYAEIVSSGDRNGIVEMVNTLMRRSHELTRENKKLFVQDRKLLASTQSILFHELAISLSTTYDEIDDRIGKLIEENMFSVVD